MAGSYARFKSLIERLTDQARHSPNGYRRRVMALAALGYAYPIVLLGAFAGFSAWALPWIAKSSGAAAVKLVLALLAFGFLVVRALWVRFEMPGGVVVTAIEAPKLFALLERIRERLKGPRTHSVLVNPDFNAAVMQVPRFGFLGGHRNVLLVGLPMMQSMSPEEFAAVLAHEYGHLSGAHGRIGNWIYRVRAMWMRMLESVEGERDAFTFLMRRFLAWYAPYFNAYSFVLARQQEYEADRRSAEFAGHENAARALTAAEVRSAYLDQRYWPAIQKRAMEVPEPDARPHGAMGRQMALGVNERDARIWVQRSLRRRTGITDTHPALSDRLKALGQPPRLAALRGTAAQAYLGTLLPALTEFFDQAWRETFGQAWQARYEQTQQAKSRVAALRAKEKDLQPDELFELAGLVEDLESEAAALELYKRVVAAQPGHAPAFFCIGRLLLARDIDKGLPLVARSMQLDSWATVPACEAAIGYLFRAGRDADATPWIDRLEERAALEQAAREERAGLGPKDEFLEHGLDPAVAKFIADEAVLIPGVKRAYLVRKRLAHFPERPLFVLGVSFGMTYGFGSTGKHDAALGEALGRIGLGERLLGIVMEKPESGAVRRRIRKAAGKPLL